MSDETQERRKQLRRDVQWGVVRGLMIYSLIMALPFLILCSIVFHW